MAASRLVRGDSLPEIVTPPPGPRSRALCRDLARFEAPGVNTLGPPGAPGSQGGEPTPVPVWEEALGSNVLDVDGNRFVDLTSGFGAAAVGHRHPRVVAAVREQSEHLLHGLGDVAAHPARIELARRLADLVPVDEPRIHFAVSGADAVEVAAKTAILATGRPGLVAFAPAYHGLSLGALALSAREHFRRPFSQHLHPHVHRLPFACDPGKLDRLAARRPDGGIAAVVLEPAVGREGVVFPQPDWLSHVADVCRRHGVLLIADEVFTGFGRTGELFALDDEAIRPDLLCCGKALGGGLPIGAVAGRAELMAAWESGGEALHTGTFLANPLSCAAALAVLDVLAEEDLVARARRLGSMIGPRVAAWAFAHPRVTATRGRGLLWGVELESAAAAKATTTALLARGVLALAGGPEGRVVQLVPPLTIAEEQLRTALDRLEECLSEPPVLG